MKTLRAFAAAATLVFAAACSTTPATPPAPKAPPGPNVTGAWTITVDSPMGKRDSDAVFTQNGQQLSGKMVSPRGEVPFTGTVTGDAIAFAFSIDAQGQQLKLDYTGKVTGDTMAGTVKFGDFGEGAWSGKKKAQ